MGDRAANMRIISNRIKELRLEAEWSQADLAKSSEVSPAAISLIEKEERLPSLMVIRKLASAFKVSEEVLTGAEGQNTQQIDKEAQAFFRDFGDIDDLDKGDKEIIKDLVKRFKDKNNDQR